MNPFLWMSLGSGVTTVGVTLVLLWLQKRSGAGGVSAGQPVSDLVGTPLGAVEIPGLLLASQSWHDSEIDRTIWLSEDMYLLEAYYDCLSGISEAVEGFGYEDNESTAVGAWVASVSVLSIWKDYRSSVLRVLSNAGVAKMVSVIDIMLAGATQKFLYDAAVAAGVEGAVDPMERIDPMIEMLMTLDDDGEGDERG